MFYTKIMFFNELIIITIDSLIIHFTDGGNIGSFSVVHILIIFNLEFVRVLLLYQSNHYPLDFQYVPHTIHLFQSHNQSIHLS